MQIEKSRTNDRLRVSKLSWKFRIQTICNFAVIYPFVTFWRSSLLFNSFYCLFWLKTKIYGSITWKLEQPWMRIFQFLLFMLKRSYICYYIICMTLHSVVWCWVQMKSRLHSNDSNRETYGYLHSNLAYLVHVWNDSSIASHKESLKSNFLQYLDLIESTKKYLTILIWRSYK